MSAVLGAQEPSAQCFEAAPPSLVRQFELIAQAPGGVIRLRELILMLAVQGKLTRRDTLAEPASVLLARILKLKASLVDAGQVKRDKPLPVVVEANPPFDIPQSWCWTRLGSVTNYGSPNKGESIGPETWVLDLEDIEKSTGRLLKRVRRSERLSLSEKNSFQAGDVLYGKLRPYLNKVIVADEPGVCTTELVPFRCYGDWVPQYFRIALSSPAFIEYVNARSYGMKMPRLGTEDARMALLPLPPLEEQARIVARVDELMQLCDALEAKGRLEAQQHARLLETLLGTLTDSTTPEELAANWQRVAEHFDLLMDRPEAVDVLEQTVLQLAVRGLLVPQDPSDEPAAMVLAQIRAHKAQPTSDGRVKRDKPLPAVDMEATPFALPRGWAWARFPELGEFGRGKSKHRPRNDPALFSPPIYPLVQTGEVARAKGTILEFHSKYSALGLAQSRLWPAGTLCITIAANIADAAVLGFDACFPDSVVGFVPASCLGGTTYFQAFLETAKTDLVKFAPATAQKNINLEILESLLVPLPPKSEIERIVARVAELRRLCADLRQRLAASQATQSRLAGALVESVVSA